jgi:hypothetical protein
MNEYLEEYSQAASRCNTSYNCASQALSKLVGEIFSTQQY